MQRPLLVVLAIFLPACGQDKPTDAQIKQQYYVNFDKVEGFFKILDYKKINGYKEKDSIYIAEINTKIEYLIDFNEFINKMVEQIYQQMPFKSDQKNKKAAK